MPNLTPTRHLLRLIICGVGTLSCEHARAAAQAAAPDCSVAANSLDCRLSGILTFLYIAAAVLALVLLLVIWLAVRSYRRKEKEDE